MSAASSDNVIRLADCRPGHVVGAVGRAADAANVPRLDGMDGALWESLLKIGSRLMVASCEIKRGQTDPARASAYLWRVAQAMEDMATRADRLERKYRKAKRKAKRHG